MMNCIHAQFIVYRCDLCGSASSAIQGARQLKVLTPANQTFTITTVITSQKDGHMVYLKKFTLGSP